MPDAAPASAPPPDTEEQAPRPVLRLGSQVADLEDVPHRVSDPLANDLLTVLRALGREELTPASPARLGLAAAGFLAAFAATLPSVPVTATASVAVAGLVAAVSATVLTGPAMVVLHQYLRLRARPRDLLAAVGQGFAEAGHVALGLSPLVLFLAVTSPLALPALLLLLGAAVLVVLVQTLRRLVHLEASAEQATLLQAVGMGGVGLAWVALTGVIGVRVATTFLFPAFASLG